MLRLTLSAVLFAFVVAAFTSGTLAAEVAPPKVGDAAADFELLSLGGAKASLAKLRAAGPVVLVVLRGYPGYQCPACSKQAGDMLAAAEKFKAAGAQVVLIYPGPSKGLAEKAKEFYRDQTIPAHFHLLIDPDYSFTNLYRLRWNARGETAYPSTFVIVPDGKITFAQISQSHGGRTPASEVLKALGK